MGIDIASKQVLWLICSKIGKLAAKTPAAAPTVVIIAKTS
jgi:hypothetical protein